MDIGTNTTPSDSYLIYDGDCPFCTDYVDNYLAFKKEHGPLKLISARDAENPIVRDCAARYNLDNGFLFIFKGAEYYGADAIHVLNMLSEPANGGKKIIAAMFRNKLFARTVYPVLATLRKIYFRLRGKPLIND